MRFVPFATASCVLALFTIAGCQSTPSTAAGAADSSSVVAPAAKADQPVATLWINGMACPQCSYNVDLQLKKVDGVEQVKVDMLTGKVLAYLSPSHPPSREQLTRAIADTTFTLVRMDMPGDNATP
ncbi:MAG TPA: heavy metal-associated domain-containing protein [Phycisphaerales bacterium]|nr:heavy metal-associated domain-containing protein [Phycisphaerales bacterium]